MQKDSNASNHVFNAAVQSYANKLQLTAGSPLFEAASPSEVLSIAQTESDRYRKESSLHRALNWTADILEPFLKFTSAIDAGISSHPELGGIIWGCIRFILTVVCSHAKYFDMIVTTLLNISRRLQFYQDYAVILYKDSAHVQASLARVYGSILDFCHEVHHVFFKPGKRARRGSLSTFAISIQPWRETKMRQIISDLDDVRTHLEEVVQHTDRMVLHEERNHKDQRMMDLTITLAGKEIDDNAFKYQRLLGQIPATEYLTTQRVNYAKAATDPFFGQWLLHHQAYVEWADPQLESRNLWIKGKPGSGKSILASLLVQDLLNRQDNLPYREMTTAYFYCRHDRADQQDAVKILGTMLKQLILQLTAAKVALPPSLCDIQVSLDSLEDLVIYFQEVSSFFRTVYLVIDGLDECSPTRRDALRAALMSARSGDVRVLFVSRSLPDWSACFSPARTISVLDNDVMSDIHRFVKRRVISPGSLEPTLHVSSPQLRQKVIDALVARADGMFLWVDMQLTHLSEQRTDHDIICALDSLPRGLAATYDRALQSIGELPPRRRTRARRVFCWLSCVGNAMPLELLQRAVVVDDMGDSWDNAKTITDPKSLIDDCANLVKLSSDGKENWVVQFTHASVQEYLVDEARPCPPSFPLPTSLAFLYSEVFRTCCHASMLLSGTFDTANSLLVEYIKTQSLTQVSAVDEVMDPSELFYLFQRILSRRSVSPFFKYFSELSLLSKYPANSTIISLAAFLSCPRLVQYCLQLHPDDVNRRDKQGRTALHYATGFLSSSCVIPNSGKCLALLLTAPEVHTWAADYSRRTPLHYIAAKPTTGGLSETHAVGMVEQLLRSGADPTSQDIAGACPIHLAVMNNYPSHKLLDVLLLHRSSINVKDHQGDSPLHRILQKRSTNAYTSAEDVKYLCAHGADPNSRNSSGLTPLQIVLCRPENGEFERLVARRIVKALIMGGARADNIFGDEDVGGILRKNWMDDKKMIRTISSARDGYYQLVSESTAVFSPSSERVAYSFPVSGPMGKPISLQIAPSSLDKALFCL